jgi:DNA-directed RNA polymerase specialized sigma24 family protein
MMATANQRSTPHDEGLPALRAHLHTFIARRVESPEVADDLTQEVLVRLLTTTTAESRTPRHGCTGSRAT